MNWLKKIFGKTHSDERPDLDMRTTPVDNPLDYREDGSIHPGDPAWNVMMEAMEGKPFHATQRPDGTWDVQ